MICFLKRTKKRNLMLRDKQKKLFRLLLTLFICTLTTIHLHADLTSLAKNDAIPPFSTLNWDDSHLLTRTQLLYRDYDWAEKKHDRFVLSISPFAQNADRGKTIRGQNCTLPNPFTDDCGNTITDTPLGDLTGRTPMISLLYNDDGMWPGGIPTTDPDKAFAGKPTLLAAYNKFFSQTIPNPPCPNQTQPCENTIGFNSEGNIDPREIFGYFSFPLKYRKRGVRFE